MVVGWLLCWAAGTVVVSAVGAAGVGVWWRWGALLDYGLLEGCLGVVPNSEAELGYVWNFDVVVDDARFWLRRLMVFSDSFQEDLLHPRQKGTVGCTCNCCDK